MRPKAARSRRRASTRRASRCGLGRFMTTAPSGSRSSMAAKRSARPRRCRGETTSLDPMTTVTRAAGPADCTAASRAGSCASRTSSTRAPVTERLRRRWSQPPLAEPFGELTDPAAVERGRADALGHRVAEGDPERAGRGERGLVRAEPRRRIRLGLRLDLTDPGEDAAQHLHDRSGRAGSEVGEGVVDDHAAPAVAPTLASPGRRAAQMTQLGQHQGGEDDPHHLEAAGRVAQRAHDQRADRGDAVPDEEAHRAQATARVRRRGEPDQQHQRQGERAALPEPDERRPEPRGGGRGDADADQAEGRGDGRGDRAAGAGREPGR